MPAILHREAYERAAGCAPDVALFETWEQRARVRDTRTAELRCGAVYADWLVQLNSRAHSALLHIRNLRIDPSILLKRPKNFSAV